jgi:hypothetical protein
MNKTTLGILLGLLGPLAIAAYTPPKPVWNGYHTVGCTWPLASTTAGGADFSNDATSCSLTQVVNQSFGTVATTGATTPGLTFTAPKTGILQVCATVEANGPNAFDWEVYLYDGTSNLSAQMGYTNATGLSYVHKVLCGVKSVTAGTSYTYKIRGRAASGTMNVGNGQVEHPIEWTMIYVD